MLNEYIRSFKAEFIKTKASGIKWLCLGAALFIPTLQFLLYITVKEFSLFNKPDNPWMDFIQNSFAGFVPFFYPLLLVLIIIRLAQFEHKSDTWKLLETQPIRKAALYFSKFSMALLIALVCLLLLLLISAGFAWLLSLLLDEPNYKTTGIEWTRLLSYTIRIWIAGFGMMALQYLLSITIPNFVGPFVIGLIATIAGSIMLGMQVMTWWMYAVPSVTSSQFEHNAGWLLPHEQFSLLFMVMFLFIGFRLFNYKTFRFAFLKPASRMIPVVAGVAIFGVAFYLFNQVKESQRGGVTVLAGSLTSEENIQQVYLLDLATRDTLDVIPVQNNRFAKHLNAGLQPNYYYLKFGSNTGTIFMGNGDSLYVEASFNDQKSSLVTTGTRMPENKYRMPGNANEEFWFLENMAHQYRPAEYARQILRNWQKGEERIESFKTITNEKPSADFQEIQKKLLRIQLLTLLDQHYPQVFRVYYPNEKLEYPEDVEKLRQSVSLDDTTLLFSDRYLQFVASHHRKASGAFDDAGFFQYLATSVPAGSVRDAVLYKSLSEFISRSSDSSRRQVFLNTYGRSIASARRFRMLEEKNRIMNNMKRGKPAPEIRGENLVGNTFKLSDLKGRFVVIDVWATWCGPCKKEDPFFRDLADRYTSENVAFVSISIDEKKEDWKIEALDKGRKVMQVWATHSNEDMNEFNVESIPRFILLDPQGRILHAQMPRPSQPEFESILQREVFGGVR